MERNQQGFNKMDKRTIHCGGGKPSNSTEDDAEFKKAKSNFDNGLEKIPVWIKNGVVRETIEFAENAGKVMEKTKLTTSQIRNIYGEVKRIQMGGFEKNIQSFYLLKPKVAYAVSRQDKEGIEYFQKFFNKSYPAIHNNQEFNNFCDIMESIIAFHKMNGGK